MRHKKFLSMLKTALGYEAILVPGPNKVSGIYKKSREEGCNSAGLLWIAAIPSPRWFFVVPEKDFFDENNEYHRGWKTIVTMLVEKGVMAKARAAKVFGWATFVPGKAGKLTPIPGWNEPTRLDKIEKEWGIRAMGSK